MLEVEIMQLKSQLKVRDDLIQHIGGKLLSIVTDGKAGWWSQ